MFWSGLQQHKSTGLGYSVTERLSKRRVMRDIDRHGYLRAKVLVNQCIRIDCVGHGQRHSNRKVVVLIALFCDSFAVVASDRLKLSEFE